MTTTSFSREALVRLEAQAQGATRLAVDRSFPGRIENASLVTTGPALGHGFELDRTSVEQVVKFGRGIRGRWTHGGLSGDGLGRHLGAWENVRALPFRLCRACEAEAGATSCATCGAETEVAWRAVGDFVFAASAHQLRPDGLDVPAPVYLMDRAEEDPRSLGISVVARFDFEEVEAPAAAGPVAEPVVEPVAEPEGEARRGGERGDDRPPPRRLARLASQADLKRGDWVADPAANPVGLSERPALHAGTAAPSELTEAATRALDRIVRREGATRAKLRALAFLARYFRDDLAPPGDDLEAEVVALRAKVDAFEREDAARRRAEAEAYLERLRTESAAAQAPIPDEDLERVAALLRDGQVETAKVVGELLLARSKAQGQVAFERGGSLPLVPPGEAPPKDRSVAAVVRLLRGRGWRVELDPQGGAITSAAPRSSSASAHGSAPSSALPPHPRLGA